MSKIATYIFYLILLFLVLVYWKGATENAKTFSGAIGELINKLQGKNADGSITQYPN